MLKNARLFAYSVPFGIQFLFGDGKALLARADSAEEQRRWLIDAGKRLPARARTSATSLTLS